jgi:hypothetical protein
MRRLALVIGAEHAREHPQLGVRPGHVAIQSVLLSLGFAIDAILAAIEAIFG